jgi:hypothetical protein
MLRNPQEVAKCRQQLSDWYWLNREIARMNKHGRLVDASDLVDVINKHIESLKEQIDQSSMFYRRGRRLSL